MFWKLHKWCNSVLLYAQELDDGKNFYILYYSFLNDLETRSLLLCTTRVYSIVQTDVDISHKVWYTQDNAAVSGMRLQIVQLSAKMDSIATKKIAVGGGLVFRHLVCLFHTEGSAQVPIGSDRIR